MLQYSYVLAYYLDAAPLHAIFEENQKDLEHNTELLSGNHRAFNRIVLVVKHIALVTGTKRYHGIFL